MSNRCNLGYLLSRFSLCKLCHFLTSDFMKMYRQWVPCKHNSLYNFNPFFLQLYTSFFHGLKMCMWFGFNPAVNFCHFSTLLTLSFFNFFAGATSTSSKFNLYFYCYKFAFQKNRFSIVYNRWLPIYLCPIKGPMTDAKKYVFSPILKKKSQSERKKSKIRQYALMNIAR